MCKKCVVCGNQVDFDVVKEEIEYLIDQADALGLESLTESEQTAVMGFCCSYECFEKLE